MQTNLSVLGALPQFGSAADRRGQERACLGVLAVGMQLLGAPGAVKGCWRFPNPCWPLPWAELAIGVERWESWAGDFKQKCWNYLQHLQKLFDRASCRKVPRTCILTRKEPIIISDVSTIILWIYSMTRASLFPRQQNSNPIHDCSKGGLLSFHSFEETHNLMGKMPEIIRQNSTINPSGSKISAVRISHQKSWKSNQSLNKIFSVECKNEGKKKVGGRRQSIFLPHQREY